MASISALPARHPYGSDQDLGHRLDRPILGGRVHIVVIGAHPDDPETGCSQKLTGKGANSICDSSHSWPAHRARVRRVMVCRCSRSWPEWQRWDKSHPNCAPIPNDAE